MTLVEVVLEIMVEDKVECYEGQSEIWHRSKAPVSPARVTGSNQCDLQQAHRHKWRGAAPQV